MRKQPKLVGKLNDFKLLESYQITIHACCFLKVQIGAAWKMYAVSHFQSDDNQ